jgi:hypothetical protein
MDFVDNPPVFTRSSSTFKFHLLSVSEGRTAGLMVISLDGRGAFFRTVHFLESGISSENNDKELVLDQHRNEEFVAEVNILF